VRTTIDVELLRKELEHVTAHPDEWDQSRWIVRTSCGTTGCLAGGTALRAGYVPYEVTDVIGQLTWVYVDHDDPVRNDDSWEDWIQVPDLRVLSVQTVARRLLGLTNIQAMDLFAPHNTLEDLWIIASELTDGAIEVPPSVIEAAREPHRDGDDVR
jgi:hypothetical protein